MFKCPILLCTADKNPEVKPARTRSFGELKNPFSPLLPDTSHLYLYGKRGFNPLMTHEVVTPAKDRLYRRLSGIHSLPDGCLRRRRRFYLQPHLALYFPCYLPTTHLSADTHPPPRPFRSHASHRSGTTKDGEQQGLQLMPGSQV